MVHSWQETDLPLLPGESWLEEDVLQSVCISIYIPIASYIGWVKSCNFNSCNEKFQMGTSARFVRSTARLDSMARRMATTHSAPCSRHILDTWIRIDSFLICRLVLLFTVRIHTFSHCAVGWNPYGRQSIACQGMLSCFIFTANSMR